MNLIYAEMISSSWGVPVDFGAALIHGWTYSRAMCIATGFLMTLSGKIRKLARKWDYIYSSVSEWIIFSK